MNYPPYLVRISGTKNGCMSFNGTGFVVDKIGHVVTCWHVVSQADEITVHLPFTMPWKYRVYKKDESEDLVLLECIVPPSIETPKASLHPDWWGDTYVGHAVTVWGFSAPKNYSTAQRFDCTISGFSENHGRIGLNGDINQGDSGAPVINAQGKVIGIAQVRDPNRNGQAMAIPISLLFKIFQPETSDQHSSDVPRKGPIQVPLLTKDFIELPEMEREIKSHLFSNNDSREILAITAIQGMGGIGKTTLATFVVNDEEVQKHFSDGILWVSLGQDPDKLSLLNKWIEAFGDYQSNQINEEKASEHLKKMLDGKHILLVVDDVWESEDVKPFLVSGSHCQTIITTRKAYIADDLSARSYPLTVMTEEQSLELFENVLKDYWDKNEKEDALKVAKDVGYLPLALNLAAKRRKRRCSWAELHKSLEDEILSVLESPRRLRKGEERLEASLNLSLKALRYFDTEVWEKYIWLGVLPEDVKINERMASTIWDIDKEEAGRILEILWEEGLLMQDLEIQLGNEKIKTYRMHDLFHDIARHYLTLSPITKKDTDIPGLGLKINEAHASLLDRYQSKTQKKGLWHTLKDDAYIHNHLTWHMEKAARIGDIHTLLSEENENRENGWYEALESLGQNAVFTEDVMRAWNLCEKESEQQIEQGSKASSIGLEIRYALIYTSINSLSANIPVELLAALLETEKWTEAKVFVYAQKEPDPSIRAEKLISVYQKTKYESIKRDALGKALYAASKIQDDYMRVQALSTLVSKLDGKIKEEVVKEALELAFKIQNGYIRTEALSVLVPNLDGKIKEEVMGKVLDAAFKIQDDSERARKLSALVPNLDGEIKEEVMEKVLDAASKIQNDSERARILSALVSNSGGKIKEEVMEKALDAASKIQDDSERAWILSTIVPNLDGKIKEEVMEKALDAVSKIQDNYDKTWMLTVLVPNLDGKIKDEVMEIALDAASKIQDDSDRSRILSALVPNLDGKIKEEVMEKALDAASKIQNDSERARALSTLVSKLDGKKEEVVKKALDATSKIQDACKRARILSALVPNLDGQIKEKVVEKGLDAASKIQDDSERAQILSAIVPILNGNIKEEVMEKTLDAVSKIQDDSERTQMLSALVPNLDGKLKEEVVKKALDAVSKIQDDSERTRILSALVPNLDGKLKEEVTEKALNAVSKIQDDSERTRILSALVPNLDGKLKEEVTEKALDATSKIQDDSERARMLSAIVPNLDGKIKEEVMEKALDAVSKIQDNYDKTWMLTVLVPNLDGKIKEEVMKKTLDIASKIRNDYHRARILSALVPNLDGKLKEEVTEKAFDAVSKIKSDSERARMLSALVLNLDGKIKEELMKKTLDMASKIQHNLDITKASYVIIFSHLRNLPMNNLYYWLRRTIKISSERTRNRLFIDIIPLISIINDLGKDETIFEISHAIIDVSQWWP